MDETLNTGDSRIELGDFNKISTKKELLDIIAKKNIVPEGLLKSLHYEEELRKLNIEMVKLQQWI